MKRARRIVVYPQNLREDILEGIRKKDAEKLGYVFAWLRWKLSSVSKRIDDTVWEKKGVHTILQLQSLVNALEIVGTALENLDEKGESHDSWRWYA